MRLLLVEDDLLLGEGIRNGLNQEGYTVDWLQNGLEADAALEMELFDLLILDLNLPGRSGLDILANLRSRRNDLPVLILTARDTISDCIAGLDSGADDFMTKPFDLEELAARTRALLRRSNGRSTPHIIYGDLSLDPASHQAIFKDEAVDLSPKEFRLLRMLMENTGRVLSRSRLEETLYGWNSDIESNAVEVHIHHLRKKFGKDLIKTIRGVGYMIEKLSQ